MSRVKPTIVGILGPTIVVIVITVLLMVGADRLLGLAGFSDAVPIQVTHPPNYSGARQSPEFSYRFETNSHGLRYPELTRSKDPNEYRVLLLGDSFTEGDGVEQAQTFGSLLELRYDGRLMGLPRVRFINGGLSGIGPLEYWRLFRRVGLGFSPDAVVVVVMANDIENMPVDLTYEDLYVDNENPKRSAPAHLFHALLPYSATIVEQWRNEHYRDEVRRQPIFEQIRERAQRRGIPLDRVVAWEKSLPEDVRLDAENVNQGRLAFGLLRPDFLTNNLNIDTPDANRKWEAMTLALGEIHRLSSERGLPMLLVFVPFDYQYDRRRFTDWDPWISAGMRATENWLNSDSVLQARLSSWSKKEQIPYLDLTPSFREALKANPTVRFNYSFDGHWNAEGHKLAAKIIGDWLQRDDRLPFKDAAIHRR